MPEPQSPTTTHRPRFSLWAWIFALVALEGMGAAVYLVRLPSDAGGRFLGLSASRLLLVAVLLGWAAVFAFLAWRARQGMKSRASGKAGARSAAPPWPGWLSKALFVLLPLVALVCVAAPLTMLSIYHTAGDFRYFAYAERLQPLFTWLLLACLEIFAGLAWSGDFHWSALREQRGVFIAGLVAWVAFGLVCLFAAQTGIGLIPDKVGWGLPTVSLMEWQIWLAWLIGVAFLLLLAYRSWPASRRVPADMLLALVIWLLACGLWLSQPVRPAFFATAGRAPNNEIYPFSDGAYYGHFAQSLLIGEGFKGREVPPRPLYITLLAEFHLLAGQKYEAIIAVQTLLLAFFPVVLFFLGKALHSRPAGLMIALLAILREVTAIYSMPFTDNASNSKLFFADLPAALAVSLWVLVAVLWLKNASVTGVTARRPLLPLLVGGCLGVAMLFRTQSMFMLPGILLLALFAYRWRWGSLLRAGALLGIGLALTLAPWLLRNGAITGRLAFDDDKSQTGSMAARYSLSGVDESYTYRPGEDPKAYSARVTQGIFRFLREHPYVVAGFVGAHWINAETANLLVLPVRSGIADAGELILPVRATWQDWNGRLDPWQAFLFAVNLGLVALGIGASWARLRWAGLALLLANLSYNFSNALARNSGGRYLLVVDWAGYAYAAIGLLEIAIAVLSVLGVPAARLSSILAAPVLTPREVSAGDSGSARRWLNRRQWGRAAAIALAFCLVGALPALVEQLIPERYPPQSRAALVQEVVESPGAQQAGLDQSALEHFAAQPGAVLIKGRALYPRYYAPGQGEPQTAKTGYEPLDYARTIFLITARSYNGLAILKAQAVPTFFPNTADVLVLGCSSGTYLDARLVLVLNGQGGAYLADAGIPQTCPPLP